MKNHWISIISNDILASIISKKAAEQIGSLVLDVKCGKGSFNKTEAQARELATKMVKYLKLWEMCHMISSAYYVN